MDSEGIFMREAAGWCTLLSCPTRAGSQTEAPGPPPHCQRRRSVSDERPAPLSMSSMIARRQKANSQKTRPAGIPTQLGQTGVSHRSGADRRELLVALVSFVHFRLHEGAKIPVGLLFGDAVANTAPWE